MKARLFVMILSIALISSAAAQPGRDVTWTQVDSAPHPFFQTGSGVLGNYFYCFGGVDSCWAQAFNLTTERWEESTPPPMGLYRFVGVATDNAIYLIGGSDYSSLPINQLQKFVPMGGGSTGTWTQMAPYPFSAWGMAAAWDGGNYIYAAGGYDGGTPFATAYRYHLSSNAWTAIADMPYSMNWSGGAFIHGRFYVVGGTMMPQTLLEYNPDNNIWTQKTPPPLPIYNGNSTTLNDSLLFSIGGGGISFPQSNAVQVYNPWADSWTQETPLPLILGANSARFIPPDKVISAGGYMQGQYLSVTHRGTGFPLGSPSSYLTVSLVPFVQPIQIPASGGTFDFYAFVNNTATFSQEVDIWTKVIAPGGIFGPLMGPATVEMDTGTRGWVRHQNVPGRWVPGLYTYIAYVGDYPSGNIWATDSLQFTKLTTGDGPWVGDWSCTGEEIGETEKTLITHHSALITSVQPNPFNPTTAIGFELRDAGLVTLRIFDTAGRLAAELINGWRDAGAHEVTFDGSGLASGIYVYRLEAGQYAASGKMVLMK
ncbi:MAG TPA: kelch repeat-containing protein [bacterium]